MFDNALCSALACAGCLGERRLRGRSAAPWSPAAVRAALRRRLLRAPPRRQGEHRGHPGPPVRARPGPPRGVHAPLPPGLRQRRAGPHLRPSSLSFLIPPSASWSKQSPSTPINASAGFTSGWQTPMVRRDSQGSFNTLLDQRDEDADIQARGSPGPHRTRGLVDPSAGRAARGRSPCGSCGSTGTGGPPRDVFCPGGPHHLPPPGAAAAPLSHPPAVPPLSARASASWQRVARRGAPA